MVGATAIIIAVTGIGVVLGLMTFGFFGARPAKIVGVVAVLATAPFAIGALHEYATLTASLVAYSVSAVVCTALSWRNTEPFNFSVIAARTGDFDPEDQDANAQGAARPDDDPTTAPAPTGSH